MSQSAADWQPAPPWLMQIPIGSEIRGDLRMSEPLPARNKRKRIFRKNVYHKRGLDTRALCGDENLERVHIRGDQTIAFHGHPLTGVGGALVCNPLHLPIAITGRGLPRGRWRRKPSAKRNTSSCFAGGRWRTLSRMA